MKIKNILSILLVAIACVAPNVYADDAHAGYVTVDVEGLNSFENIISNAPFDVEFTQSDVRSVKVYAAPEEVGNVNLSIVGKTLFVGVKENTNVSQKAKVIITAPELLCAIVSASGDIEVKNLNNTKFTATVSGSGDVELVGSCDEAEYTVSGSGKVDADDFLVKDILRATVSGSGSIDCRVLDTLYASVTGSGNIEYHGHPRTINRSGRRAGIRHD
ncbi:MAG: DUF2807 domain-containing protein [Bacteroidaceae bacterium]|nr:DUF2807 domain-containing protein [Bacteroidaceae bacterium]